MRIQSATLKGIFLSIGRLASGPKLIFSFVALVHTEVSQSGL